MNSTIQQSQDATHIYYDIQLYNYQSSNTSPPALRFIENRNTAILSTPNLYSMYIAKFSIDTPSLPIFTAQIQPAPNLNPNLTIYSITLSYNGIDIQEYIHWIPQDSSLSVPSPPSPLQNNSFGYYNAYSYQHVINVINIGFSTAFNKLYQAVEISDALFHTGILPTRNPPFLIWDIQTNSAILNADSAGFTQSDSGVINIYFNNSLYTYFSSFYAIYSGYQSINGKNKQIVITNNESGSNSIQYPISGDSTPYTAIQVFQEYSTIDIWTPISNITFTSNSLPIVSNLIATPQIYYDQTQATGSSSGSNSSQIITDMTADGMYKPNLLYTPAFPRKISLLGTSDIKVLDIEVYYKTKTGELIPFLLNSGCSASIKISFEKIV